MNSSHKIEAWKLLLLLVFFFFLLLFLIIFTSYSKAKQSYFCHQVACRRNEMRGRHLAKPGVVQTWSGTNQREPKKGPRDRGKPRTQDPRDPEPRGTRKNPGTQGGPRNPGTQEPWQPFLGYMSQPKQM